MATTFVSLPHRTLLDGGLGTQLIGRGLRPAEEPAELWNLRHPRRVLEVHQSFLEAGASALQTNTFGGNRMRLARFGLAGEVEAVNTEAVALARQAAGPALLVIGSIGPTGELPPPEGNADLVALEDAFAEQASALAAAGVDMLCVETMYHPKEARAALRGCQAGASDVPRIASMTCRLTGQSYRTILGFTPESMLGVFVEEGADAIGLNCNLVPADMLDLVRLLTSRTERPLFVRPTAAPDCRVHVHPADFATGVEALFALGAHAVGGCCGTGPDHIAAARSALDGAPAAFIR